MLYEYKKNGETMQQFIQRVKEKHNIKKLAYTARLDPMARGIVPFVVEEECVKIKEHLNTDKTYQVKIILGIQTDTDDCLGIITKMNITEREGIYKKIIEYLEKTDKTSFIQKYHYFSTKMLNHRRQKSKNVIDTHNVSLYKYEIQKDDIYDYEKWKTKIINQIKMIDNTKDFRQEQTIKQWNELEIKEMEYIKINLTVSSGFFVRQFIRDISENINYPLMCYNIYRKNIL
jgi:tRNA pseudouridine(55) synthase